MANISKSDLSKYTSYVKYNELLTKIKKAEEKLSYKMFGGLNSTPLWGDVSIISANVDGSFFVRWGCADPRNKKIEYSLKVNEEEFIPVVAWYSGNNYTCFVPKGIAKPGLNSFVMKADNGFYSSESSNFSVNIPIPEESQPPNISQELPPIEGKVGEPVSITYTASDNGIITKHSFWNGKEEVDITEKVASQGTQFVYTTSWEESITIDEAYIKVEDNFKLTATSNKFRIVIE